MKGCVLVNDQVAMLNSKNLVSGIMKSAIHPEYKSVKATCSCGHSFETRSTLCHDMSIEVCSNCHPFYTGKQKLHSTGGRVQKFRDRYKKRDVS